MTSFAFRAGVFGLRELVKKTNRFNDNSWLDGHTLGVVCLSQITEPTNLTSSHLNFFLAVAFGAPATSKLMICGVTNAFKVP
jgi:hypothetical protein